jgi:Fe-S-cluster-containing dehydrogenase component/formate-dependent nitrite reductase membrane component NrfD
VNYGFVIDNGSCIGCHACSTACKSENEVPLGVYRTWVKSVEVGAFPEVSRSFQVTRCNHCAHPPCVQICPTAAMHQRPDGIVDFDSDACIGCKACIQACPYDAIHLDPSSSTAAKCHFCAHRVDVGLEPACVVVCPEHAIIAGDMDDPNSEISRVLGRTQVTVRKPEQGTRPKLFYIQGQLKSLDPTASPPQAGYAWATSPEHRDDERPITVAGPQAAAMMRVSYDVHHKHYWHWPIAAYLVTKHVAGGGFFLMSLLALAGTAPSLWAMGGALVALAVTLGLLIYDLDRPDRFLYLLVRPQWRSWVARAAWILTALSVLGTAWFGLELLGLTALRPLLAVLTAPAALLAAIYTAFLFAQAEGRDLWQAPHQPLLMTSQALVLGAALLALTGGEGSELVRWLMFGGSLAGLLLVLVGDLGPQQTTVARAGARAMTRGKYRWWWRSGVALGYAAPVGLALAGQPLLAGLCASVGIFCHALSFVLAPQTVRNS